MSLVPRLSVHLLFDGVFHPCRCAAPPQACALQYIQQYGSSDVSPSFSPSRVLPPTPLARRPHGWRGMRLEEQQWLPHGDPQADTAVVRCHPSVYVAIIFCVLVVLNQPSKVACFACEKNRRVSGVQAKGAACPV